MTTKTEAIEETELITGNQAVAKAVMMAGVRCVPAYPITPQTVIVETISQLIDSGQMDAEFILVESEHSAMAAAIGSSLAGVRTFTATSSHGLLYMGELVFWAGMTRIPLVMANVNRSLNPWNIWPDHQDSMAFRDAGWIQFYGKNNQEVFDLVLQAFRIAEHHKIWMPTMICLDGFILSHTSSLVNIPPQSLVSEFVGEFKPLAMLDTNDPFSHGSLTASTELNELRRSIMTGFDNARILIPKIMEEFSSKFGRDWGGLLEVKGDVDQANVAVIAMGTLGEETEQAVKYLAEEEGKHALSVRIRAFRPFPKKELAEILSKVEKIIIIDRAVSFGNEGQIAIEVKALLYDEGMKKEVHALIKGLGGLDVDHREIVKEIKKVM
ncbi:MAG: pyruvate ferredoxin oxidoreductase [Promethearchaeota archaeon]